MPEVRSPHPYLHLSPDAVLKAKRGELTTVCVTDLGTNSFHSVVLKSGPGEIEIVDRLKQPVALGSDGLAKGFLSDSAIERAVNAMLEVRELGLKNNVDGHMAIATSAVRESANQAELLKAIHSRTGIEIDVISGAEEAYLIYRGVTGSLHLPTLAVLVDIGGGSTEITLASSQGIEFSGSHLVGAARLTEQFVANDPVSAAELRILFDHLDELLGPVVDDIAGRKIRTMVGSSGTIENLARIAMRMPLDVMADKEFGISAYAVEATAREILYSSRSTRERIPELSPSRIDQIVAGAALVVFLIERSGVELLRISPFALREGVMLEYADHLQSKRDG